MRVYDNNDRIPCRKPNVDSVLGPVQRAFNDDVAAVSIIAKTRNVSQMTRISSHTIVPVHVITTTSLHSVNTRPTVMTHPKDGLAPWGLEARSCTAWHQMQRSTWHCSRESKRVVLIPCDDKRTNRPNSDSQIKQSHVPERSLISGFSLCKVYSPSGTLHCKHGVLILVVLIVFASEDNN